MLKEALQYSGIGFSVIPIQPKGKKPLIPWEEYQRTRASEEVIKRWWEKWPDANLGVVTGDVSGIVVVDLEYDGLTLSQNLHLSSTLIASTGKGRHLYFKYPGTEICNRAAINKVKGFDLRGDGGYVLVPPSLHPDGKKYTWLTPLRALSSLPEFPIQKILTPLSPTTTTTTTTENRNPKGWIGEALKEMQVGNRDYTIFRICSRLRADGYSPDDVLTLLSPHVIEAGKTIEQLQAKIDNVWSRYPANRSTMENQAIIGQSLSFRTFHNSQEEYRKRKQQRHSVEYRTGFPKLDFLTGGYQRSEILTVAALPGTGKTNFAIATSIALCKQGKHVVFLSTEMSFDRIWDRFISESDDALLETGLFSVCDDFTPDIPRIELALKEHKPDIFVFDHISHVAEEHIAVAEFMKGLKGLARKFNIPGLVMAELNRNADFVINGKRVIPRMSMIKGSATIEQVSAQILLLDLQSELEEQDEIIGVLDKNRYGSKGNIMFLNKKHPYQFVEQPE